MSSIAKVIMATTTSNICCQCGKFIAIGDPIVENAPTNPLN
jgi:hypothetical protein